MRIIFCIFGIDRKFRQHTFKCDPACRLDGVKKPNDSCVPRKGTSCIGLAGFGVCAFSALTSPLVLCGIFSRMKGKSVLGDMAFPSFLTVSSLAVLASNLLPLFQLREETMPKYFYNDANGQTQGPFDLQQLQDLADQEIITPTTPLATDTGHTGLARQIPGLKFKRVVPPPFEQTAQEVGVHARQATGSVFTWLFDFAFRDIRLHIVNLWFCRIGYILCWVVAILSGLWYTYQIFRMSEYMGPLVLLAMPFLWLGVIIYMFVIRLCFEFCLAVLDWMIETTKAARIYIENNKRD